MDIRIGNGRRYPGGTESPRYRSEPVGRIRSTAEQSALEARRAALERGWMQLPVSPILVDSSSLPRDATSDWIRLEDGIDPSEYERQAHAQSIGHASKRRYDGEAQRQLWVQDLNSVLAQASQNSESSRLIVIMRHELAQVTGSGADPSQYLRGESHSLQQARVGRSNESAKEQRSQQEKYRQRLKAMRASVLESIRESSSRSRAQTARLAEEANQASSYGFESVAAGLRHLALRRMQMAQTQQVLDQLRLCELDARNDEVASGTPNREWVDLNVAMLRVPNIRRAQRCVARLELASEQLVLSLSGPMGEMLEEDVVEHREHLAALVLAIRQCPNEDGFPTLSALDSQQMRQLLWDVRFREGKMLRSLVEQLKERQWHTEDVALALESFAESTFQELGIAPEGSLLDEDLGFRGLLMMAEERVMTLCHEPCMDKLANHHMDDVRLLHVYHILRHYTPEHFGVDRRHAHPLPSDASEAPYSVAVRYIQRLAFLSVPLEMMRLLSRAVAAIVDEASRRESLFRGGSAPAALAADDLLPLVQYVVVQSQLPNLFELRAFLDAFSNRLEKSGRLGYILTTFSAAVNDISLHCNSLLSSSNSNNASA